MAIIQKSFSDLIDFTRASTATYYDATGKLVTAGVNEPRFDHDPATGECRGLLVEGQATNLQTRSESTTGWSMTRGVSSIEDGWFEFLMNAGATSAYANGPPTTIEAGKTYAFSAEVRPYANSEFMLRFHPDNFGEYKSLILSKDGSWSLEGDGLTGGAKYRGDGVYFLWISATATITNGRAPYFWSSNPLETDEAFYFRQPQLEVGSFPTSYIPTEGSQVTRAADNVEIRGEAFTSWFNPAGGTFVFDRGEAPYTGITRFTLTVGKDSSSYLGLDYSQSVIGYFQPFSGGGISANNSDLSDPHIYAISWEVLGPNAVQVAIARDGVVLANNTYPGDTSTINEWDVLQLGQRFGGFRPAQLYVKRLSYYPRRLTDTQLQELTS